MGFYERVILPRLIRLALDNRFMHEQRERALAGVRGRVLEIGFGNGLNLRHYPRAVDSVVGIDPSPAAATLARKDIARCGFPVEVRTGSAEALPFADSSFDSVAMTWTLCTIPAPELALREIRRVLKPGGMLHFVEHGYAPDAGVARWQDRLNGLQQSLCGGCHLNRRIDKLIAGAGLRLTALNNFYMPGPRTHAYLYLGTAGRTDAPSVEPGRTGG